MSALSGLSEWKKVLFLFLFLVAGIFLFSILGSIVILAVYGVDVMMNVSQSIFTPESIEALKWLQAIQNVGMFVGPGIMLAFMYSNKQWAYLGLSKTTGSNILLALAIILISIPGVNFLAAVNELIPLSDWMLNKETTAEMLLNAFLSNSSTLGFIVNIAIICIIPGFGEEIIFRGLLQKHFVKITKSQVWGIVISAFIFSAFHLQFKGFIPRFGLGLLLGYLYMKSGSIWLSVAAHTLNNIFAISVFSLMEKNLIGNQFETIGTFGHHWIIGVAGIALVVFLITKIKKTPISLDIDTAPEKL